MASVRFSMKPRYRAAFSPRSSRFSRLQIAADGSQRRPQVVGDAGDGLLQFPVTLLIALSLRTQNAELGVQISSQGPQFGITGGDGKQGVGINRQLLSQSCPEAPGRTGGWYAV